MRAIRDFTSIRVIRLERELKQLKEDLKARNIDMDELARKIRSLEYTTDKR